MSIKLIPISNDFRAIERILKISHNGSMLYSVGTHINLSHLNKRAVSTTQKKTSFEKKARELYQVGTKFIFTFTPAGQRQITIKIPMAI